MTQEQKDRALACIRGAEELGRGFIFPDAGPSCALGWLLSCAGVDRDTYYKERVNHPHTPLRLRHPQLTDLYGLETEDDLYDITVANDDTPPSERKAAVLALIESWEVEDVPV